VESKTRKSIGKIRLVASSVPAVDWLTYGIWLAGRNVKDPDTATLVIQLGLTGLFIHILSIVYLYSLVIEVTRTKKPVAPSNSKDTTVTNVDPLSYQLTIKKSTEEFEF
jgi:hypothetical protein